VRHGDGCCFDPFSVVLLAARDEMHPSHNSAGCCASQCTVKRSMTLSGALGMRLEARQGMYFLEEATSAGRGRASRSVSDFSFARHPCRAPRSVELPSLETPCPTVGPHLSPRLLTSRQGLAIPWLALSFSHFPELLIPSLSSPRR